MPYLNFVSRILAFSDVSPGANPQRRLVDWSRNLLSIPVSKPLNQVYEIPALTEVEVFDGTRTLAYTGSSEFSLALVTNTSDLYRLTWTGTGTAPVFRTDRAPNILNQFSQVGGSGTGPNSGDVGYINITPAANQTVTVTNTDNTGTPLATWSSVQVGDNVFIPGVTTGDEVCFNPMNEGLWVVLGISSDKKVLTLGRVPGTVYSAGTALDSQAIDDTDEFQIFSSSGVQVEDTLDLISGFSDQALRAYEIVSVTPTWVEFRSSIPLASETVVPGASSFSIYSSVKSFISIETDQELAIKMNGDTSEYNRITPFLTDCGDQVGVFNKAGTVYSLSLKNRSTTTANVTFISVE